MPKKIVKKDEPSKIRKAVFIVFALILVGVMGKLVVEAISFVTTNTVEISPNQITGMAYTISGGACSDELNTADCCQDACLPWCESKGQSLYKVGVVEPLDLKCKCTCVS